MEHVAVQSAPLWPLILYSVFVLILVAGMVVTSFVLGQKHRERRHQSQLPFPFLALPRCLQFRLLPAARELIHRRRRDLLDGIPTSP